MFAFLVRNRVVSLALILATLVVGYLVFRYFYEVAGDFPFTQEILLVFIGAVATVLITAVLLNQQTELELRKEGQVLLLDRKAETYSAIIEHIGRIVEQGRMRADELARLRILNHKLAMVGSAEVIARFNSVLDAIERAVSDDDIGRREGSDIMRAVAVLTFWMRRDLLGRIEGEDEGAVLAAIKANNADLEEPETAAR